MSGGAVSPYLRRRLRTLEEAVADAQAAAAYAIDADDVLRAEEPRAERREEEAEAR